MSLNSLGMGFVFTARDLASAKLSALEQRFASLDDRVTGGTERITGSFRALGIGLGVLVAGAGLVAGAFALADVAGTFEQSIAAVGAVSGATVPELQALHDAAIDAGIATQFAPTQAVNGLRELAQAGYTAQESIRLLRPVLDLAAGSLGELGPEAAAGLAAQTMKAFGLSIDDASISVDRMLQAVNVFALNANELPLALGTASRGAQALHQSLSETLITLGLVKNVIPGVERASTATAVAMERLADPQVQQRLRGIGVAVVTSQGGFRSFLDVLGDLAPALDRMTEAQRSAFLLQVFGREALGGVNAILTQVSAGIRTNTGETLRGGAALAYLRKQFDEAGGTASAFSSQMLDTFAGQKQLLRGSLETLAVVLGEPFARVLKPVVAAVVSALNLFLKFVRAVPAPVQTAFAGFLVAAGAVLSLVGAVIAAKASIGLLAIGLKALGISAGGIAATLLPAILIVAVLTAVVAGFVIAFRENLGGMGDAARRVGAAVSLVFSGLKQLFEQGGFSGAVRAELDRAENQGLKQFLIRVYQIAFRIQQVWEGFKDGFTRTIEAARPVFEDLVDAFSDLGAEISALISGATDEAAGLPSAEFRSFGEVAGAAIGTVVKWLTELVAIVTRVVSGIVGGFRSMLEYIGPAVSVIGDALGQLKDTWNALTGATDAADDAAGNSTSGWKTLGEVIGKIVGGAVTVVALALAGLVKVFAAVLRAAKLVKDVFVAVGTAIGETAAEIYRWFTDTLPNAVMSAVRTVGEFFASIGRFFASIGDWFVDVFKAIGDAIMTILGPIISFIEKVKSLLSDVWDAVTDSTAADLMSGRAIIVDGKLVRPDDEVAPAPPVAAPVLASAPMPAAIDAQTRTQQLAQLESTLAGFATARDRAPAATPPLQVNVQIDGETVARAVHSAQDANAARAFSPVPAY